MYWFYKTHESSPLLLLLFYCHILTRITDIYYFKIGIYIVVSDTNKLR